MKVSELVRSILKASGVVGVGQTPLAEDSNEGLFQLNLLLNEWNENRFELFGLENVSFTGTGATSYSVGSGQTVDVDRPSKIESAFRRQISPQVDTPIEVIRSQEDYNAIALKNIGNVPQCVFYDPTFPNGNLYVYPAPSSQYQVFLSVLRRISQFATLNETISLPNIYYNALYWCGAQSIRAAYRRPPDISIDRKAKNARTTMRKANMQIPIAKLPRGLPGMTGPTQGYNIYTDGN